MVKLYRSNARTITAMTSGVRIFQSFTVFLVTSYIIVKDVAEHNWTASSEFGTYRLCEQRWFRRACASAQSHQNLRCSLKQAVSQEEPSDRKPDPWPL